MSMPWQQLLVYGLVLWCLWRLCRKYAPNAAWRWQARLSYFFESRNTGFFKQIGRALRPAVAIPPACGTHCRSCNSCA